MFTRQFHFATLAVVFIALRVNAFDYQDCGSMLASFTKIQISSCTPPDGDFCKLKKGSNATLSINLIPKQELNKVTATVHGIIAGIPMPFHLPNPDGCTNSGLTCPLQKEVQYIYVSSIPVLQLYPQVRLTVKWELKDENGKEIICFMVPAKIVN